MEQVTDFDTTGNEARTGADVDLAAMACLQGHHSLTVSAQVLPVLVLVASTLSPDLSWLVGIAPPEEEYFADGEAVVTAVGDHVADVVHESSRPNVRFYKMLFLHPHPATLSAGAWPLMTEAAAPRFGPRSLSPWRRWLAQVKRSRTRPPEQVPAGDVDHRGSVPGPYSQVVAVGVMVHQHRGQRR